MHLNSSNDFNKSIVNHDFALEFKIDISFWIILGYYHYKIYDNKPKPIIQLNMNPVEYIDIIFAMITKIKQSKEFKSLDISQLKKKGIIEIVK